MELKEWLRKKIFKTSGLVKIDADQEDRLTFINNEQRLTKSRIQEYDIWYYGDSDELLNYYTHQNTLEYNFEPWYSRNKKSYFWSVASTELDIKRTHSGQPRNIIDTLVSITKFPVIDSEEAPIIENIIKDFKLKEVFKNQQLPLTLVEGWGCYKINFDKDVSDYPYALYYKANDVEFIERAGRIVSVLFKDYYLDKNEHKYLMVESRSIKYDNSTDSRVLVIHKDLFTADKSGDYITPVEDWSVVPELAGISDESKHIEISNCNILLAVPCIIFKNTANVGGYGRSIFTGKIDLFDDLDQCLSQAANTIRRSTVREYYNTDFLERSSETGLPIQPKAFDRKYTFYPGQLDANGGSSSKEPVQVTQPAVNFDQYSNQAVQIMLQIINGIMSPATLGIDIARKDNAEAQREKEKVTIFTRNWIIDGETDILKDLCDQLLCAYEFMTTGIISKYHYNVSVRFSEFADDSYENKLQVLGGAYDSQLLSDEMFMRKLYGDTLPKDEYERELQWVKDNHTAPRVQGAQGAMPGELLGGMNPEAAAEMEAAMGGMMGEEL